MPDTIKKYIVVRKMMPSLSVSLAKLNNIELAQVLSPVESLVNNLKSGGEWEYFKEQYIGQISSNPYAKETINQITHELQQGKNICLICYEKDYSRCHRSLLADFISKDWSEWKKDA